MRLPAPFDGPQSGIGPSTNHQPTVNTLVHGGLHEASGELSGRGKDRRRSLLGAQAKKMSQGPCGKGTYSSWTPGTCHPHFRDRTAGLGSTDAQTSPAPWQTAHRYNAIPACLGGILAVSRHQIGQARATRIGHGAEFPLVMKRRLKRA